MDDRFTDWVSRVADLRLQMTRVCRETGIDPGGLVSGSRFDALDDEVARVRSRVIALEQRPAMMPTYSSAVAPLPRTSGNDAKVLVAEMEARLTHTYATAQALEQVSKAAELASSDLRILQAQCKLDVSTLTTESASILEKVREQGTDVAAVRAQYTGLADQVALLRTMAASTQQGAPASSSAQATQGLTPRTSRQTFEDIDELRKKLEGLQVSDLRQRVDGLGVDDLRKQVEDLAQEVAHLKSERDRLESELRQVTTVPQAQPAASTSDIDALRATVEQVSADLADLRVNVEARGTTHSRLITECATNDAWHSVCDDVAGKVSLADLRRSPC
jgi:chromosome segregation ATPase